MSASSRLYKHSNRLPTYRPLPWGAYVRHIIAKDAVLWIALFLALITSVIIRPPWPVLAQAIDWKTLGCLAGLMIASGGFMISGVFDLAAARLVNHCRGARSMMAALVFSTFFSSMCITNDVALIVFVPMTLLSFRRAGLDPALTVILQTVAANVGSILLPTGNPQNLFLYSRYAMAFGPFASAVLPLFVAGGIGLALFCLCARNTAMACGSAAEPTIRFWDVLLYGMLFCIAALAVFDVLDYRLALGIAVIVMLAKGRNLVQQVDYALLLTFVGFFIFVANIATIPQVAEMMRRIVEPQPFLAAVCASQVISNVPAAVMLSSFTGNASALLAGVSAGGCGTLIASMASLISYKLYVRDGGEKKRYLLLFTGINLFFLFLMCLAHYAAQ